MAPWQTIEGECQKLLYAHSIYVKGLAGNDGGSCSSSAPRGGSGGVGVNSLTIRDSGRSLLTFIGSEPFIKQHVVDHKDYHGLQQIINIVNECS